MTPAEVLRRVEEIRALAWDDEVAHSREDDLHRDVLVAIAQGRATDPTALAEAALMTWKIDFARWCA